MTIIYWLIDRIYNTGYFTNHGLIADELARTYRNIRSSYGARKTVSVMATVNGRVSEYQAGLALKFIQNYD
jgi:hypothetical protein